jgi:hypothetical protein
MENGMTLDWSAWQMELPAEARLVKAQLASLAERYMAMYGRAMV